MGEKRKYTELTDAELRQRVDDEHIWVNAMGAVNPSEEFKAQIGGAILGMLATTDLCDSFGISPTIIVRINKS